MTSRRNSLHLNHMDTERKPIRRSLPILDEEPIDWGSRVVTAWARVHTRWERRLAEVLADHGMTLPQFDVLATLWHCEGITQQELAGRLLVSKGNVVGLIDRLCAAGLIERRADPVDRRANRLHLTDAGRKRLGEAWPNVAGFHKKILGVYTVDELRSLAGLLRRLEDSLQE